MGVLKNSFLQMVEMKIKFISEQSFQALWLVGSVGLFGDMVEIVYGSVYPLYPSSVSPTSQAGFQLAI